jgi:hypothetical protein
MKTNIKKAIFTLLFTLPLFIQVALPDPPGPPGPGGDPGGSGGIPVGSPIDNTTIVLLVLAFCYGVYKLLEFKRNKHIQCTEKL